MIVGGNVVRQVVLPFGTVPQWADVALALGLAAVLFSSVTMIHRSIRQPKRQRADTRVGRP